MEKRKMCAAPFPDFPEENLTQGQRAQRVQTDGTISGQLWTRHFGKTSQTSTSVLWLNFDLWIKNLSERENVKSLNAQGEKKLQLS
jgi:hypothetical protein